MHVNFQEKGDLRQRQSKRKIFGQDVNKSRAQDKEKETVEVNHSVKVSKANIIEITVNSVGDQMKREIQQLQLCNKQLSKMLSEQRQKYDVLFEEYEEMVEKNNVIEKEFINLKYQQNKQIKNMRKSLMEKINEFIDKAVEEFNSHIREEVIWDGIKQKIDKFIQKIKATGQIINSTKIKKHNHKEQKDNGLQKYMIAPVKLQKQQKKVQTNLFQQIIATHTGSPQKSVLKDKEIAASLSQLSCKSQKDAIVFEDEYYGELEHYPQYEEKVMKRKNYELLKNCNRSSNDPRRKKIFNPNYQA